METNPTSGTPQGKDKPHEPHEGHVEPDLPRVRTYAADLSDEIKKKGATLSTIVGEERERAARVAAEIGIGELSENAPKERPPISYKTIALAAGVVLLIALSVGVVVGALYLREDSASVSVQRDPSIIFPNRVREVRVSTESRDVTEALFASRDTAELSLGEIEKYVITIAGATTTPQSLLQKLNAPANIIREARSIMVGVHAFNRVQPFIIIRVSQYDRAFSAMLQWEEEMGRSFGRFFKPTQGTVPPTLQFTDAVFENIDIRVSQAEWPIVYAFPQRDILIITTNTATLNEIMIRLAAVVVPSEER